MLPARWDPFRDVLSLQDRINRVFSDYPLRWMGEEPVGTWVPPVDIYERGDDLVVRAEMPGLNRDDIEVNVQSGTLTLKGERKRDQEYSDENVHRIERQYGSFARSFTLPTEVDASRIKAVYKDGVLEINLPKAEAAKPKKVEIRGA